MKAEELNNLGLQLIAQWRDSLNRGQPDMYALSNACRLYAARSQTQHLSAELSLNNQQIEAAAKWEPKQPVPLLLADIFSNHCASKPIDVTPVSATEPPVLVPAASDSAAPDSSKHQTQPASAGEEPANAPPTLADTPAISPPALPVTALAPPVLPAPDSPPPENSVPALPLTSQPVIKDTSSAEPKQKEGTKMGKMIATQEERTLKLEEMFVQAMDAVLSRRMNNKDAAELLFSAVAAAVPSGDDGRLGLTLMECMILAALERSAPEKWNEVSDQMSSLRFDDMPSCLVKKGD